MGDKYIAESDSEWDASGDLSDSSNVTRDRMTLCEVDCLLPHHRNQLCHRLGSFVYASDAVRDCTSPSHTRRHTVDSSAIRWGRSSVLSVESTTDATLTPCAAETSSSASSASFMSKSPHSSSGTLDKVADKESSSGVRRVPKLVSAISEEIDSAEHITTGQRRPRVRLNERASRVAVCPHRGSRFIDPVSLMGIVQRQQHIYGSARRIDDHLTLQAVQSLSMSRFACRASSQQYSTNVIRPPSHEAADSTACNLKRYLDANNRTKLDATRWKGRLSCPQALGSYHRYDTRSHHSTESSHTSTSRRRGSTRGSLLEFGIGERQALTSRSAHRRWQQEDNPQTSVDRDMLWLAVQRHRASHRKRKLFDSFGA